MFRDAIDHAQNDNLFWLSYGAALVKVCTSC
jgi:hypothetical protein